MSRSTWQLAALLSATVTTGLTAGVFADWADTIMPGLRTTDDHTFVEAEHALDRAILSPWFLLTFVGALGLTGVAVLLCRRVDRSLLRVTAVAFVLVLAGLVITLTVHEPLNLVIRGAAGPARIADPTTIRAAFDEARWVTWHLVRTVATIVAFACLVWGLVLHGRTTADHGSACWATPHPGATRRPATR